MTLTYIPELGTYSILWDGDCLLGRGTGVPEATGPDTREGGGQSRSLPSGSRLVLGAAGGGGLHSCGVGELGHKRQKPMEGSPLVPSPPGLGRGSLPFHSSIRVLMKVPYLPTPVDVDAYLRGAAP